MRRSHIAALAATALALSCHHEAPEPAPPDFSAAQQRIWSLIPVEAQGGVTVARLDHLLERLGALRALGETGPVGKKYLTMFTGAAQALIGFDPLDAAGWRAHGIDVEAPLGLFFVEAQAVWVVRPSDAAAAGALGKQLFADRGFVCEPEAGWLVCRDPGNRSAHLAPSVDHSLWPRLQKEGDPRAELCAWAPLDGEKLRSALSVWSFAAASKSAFLGLSLGEQQIRMTMRYTNPESGAAARFFTLDPGVKSVLGAATGAAGAARFSWSPRAVWAWAKEKFGDKVNLVSGGFMMATGMDFEKDIIENFTGEVVVAYYGGDSQGMGAELFGARDEKKTRELLERIDGMLAGALAAAPDAMAKAGVKLERTVEKVQGRTVYRYKMDSSGAAPMAFEMNLTAAPGALVLAFDRGSLERALGSLGKSPKKFLDGLEPQARRVFESRAPMVAWGAWADMSGMMNSPMMASAMKLYEKIHPDLPAAVLEFITLAELIYDNTFVFDIGGDAMNLDFKVNLL
jgi:hypothetical protein